VTLQQASKLTMITLSGKMVIMDSNPFLNPQAAATRATSDLCPSRCS